MKEAKLSDENIEDYLKIFDEGSRMSNTSCSAWSEGGTVKKDSNTACYASLPDHIRDGDDHCGVMYAGYSAPIMDWRHISYLPRGQQLMMTPAYGRNAKSWLMALLEQDGPFKDILPFLRFKDADTILKHKGFLFENLSYANMDLFCTFISCSRCAAENPQSYQHYYHLRDILKYPMSWSMFVSITMEPTDHSSDAARAAWKRTSWPHGNPFGSGARGSRALSFVRGITQPSRDFFGMNGCQNVFPLNNVLPEGNIKKIMDFFKESKVEKALPAAA